MGQVFALQCIVGVAFSTVCFIITLGPVGEQQQPVRCFRAGVGVVDEELCDLNSRPDDRHRRCKNMECPARSVSDFLFQMKHIMFSLGNSMNYIHEL